MAQRVARLIILETAQDKLWAHGIVPDQVYSVLFGPSVLTHNRSQRSASHLLIGRDEHGHCLAIPVVPTDDPRVWRVITAWYCKPSEAAKLRKIMDEPARYGSSAEPLDDEERELMDPETWDWESPVEVVIAENPLVELGLEFAYDELRLLGQVARAEGIPVHQFIKQSALDVARHKAQRTEPSSKSKAVGI